MISICFESRSVFTLNVHTFFYSETIIHLGGEDKFVPLSRQRVRGINITIGVTLTLQGQPGERVTMFYYVNNQKRHFDINIDPDGVTDVVLNITSAPPLPTTSTPWTTDNVHSTTPSKASMLNLLSLSPVSLAAGFLVASQFFL